MCTSGWIDSSCGQWSEGYELCDIRTPYFIGPNCVKDTVSVKRWSNLYFLQVNSRQKHWNMKQSNVLICSYLKTELLFLCVLYLMGQKIKNCLLPINKNSSMFQECVCQFSTVIIKVRGRPPITSKTSCSFGTGNCYCRLGKLCRW